MVQELASGLPSNYHRDLQLLKKPLFGAVASVQSWLDVLIALCCVTLQDSATLTEDSASSMLKQRW